MKKYLFLVLILWWGVEKMPAQYSIDLHISPQFPTQSDTIRIFADYSFTSSPGTKLSQNQSQSGNTLYGFSSYCLGILSTFSYVTDTFSFTSLPSGDYIFVATPEERSGIQCQNVYPYKFDTLYFSVSEEVGISGHFLKDNIKISPNPANEMIEIENKEAVVGISEIRILDMLGKEWHYIPATLSEFPFHQRFVISHLPNGIYVLQIKGKTYLNAQMLIINHE
ncbi:MAG: T9SS type A sorting domain-containing protein [Bacteroidia bacterium]|nr:T9SS type A sorting domain-containing protein [Bacteroidia bacterium]